MIKLNIDVIVSAKVKSMSYEELQEFVYADLYQLCENDPETLERYAEEVADV